MRMVLSRIRRHALELLGVDKMSGSFNILTANYIFLMVYYTLESVFVNTLIYRQSGNMLDIIKYRAVAYFFSAVATNAGAYVARFRTPVSSIKLGGFSYILMYMVLFFGMSHVATVKYVVAALSGMGMGLYWTGHNILTTHYTSNENRAVGVAILGIVQGAMTLLVPVISGFVISLMPGNTGYRVMFGIGMLTVVFQRHVQNKLPRAVHKKRVGSYRLALRLTLRKSTCKLMLGFEALRGFRDGTFAFILNMMLFQIITDEGLVGINTFLTGAAAIVGSWAYGRLAVPGRRIPLMLGATTLLLALLAVQLKILNAPMVMLFSVVNSFAGLFIVYTVNTYSYNVMGQNEAMRSCMGEMCGLREIALSAGRILGLYAMTLFPQTSLGQVQAMIALVASQYLAALLIQRTKEILDRKKRWEHS